jgi:hypothetical protein
MMAWKVGLVAGRRSGAIFLIVAVPLVVVGFACGGKEGVGDAKLPSGSRSETIEHEACDEGGNRVETLDATGDGKPDIKRVYNGKTGKEVCRITDLNHDGKPDMYEYYDPNGVLRRREADFDDSGVVDMIEYYENGKLVRKELDTTGQHRIDTWDYYDGSGKRIKRERDTTNDGRVDQWWTWDADKVTIAMDKNGDGQPDPDQTIVIGGGGGGPSDDKREGGAPSANLDASAASPTLPQKQPESAFDAAIMAPDAGTPSAGPPKRKENRGGPKK